MGKLVYVKMFHSHYEALKEMPDALAGRLFKAILYYNIEEELPEMEDAEKYIFLSAFKEELDRERRKYDEKCNKNKQNIEARWAQPVAPKPASKKADFTQDVGEPGTSIPQVNNLPAGIIDRMITLWNKQSDLPPCKRMSATMSSSVLKEINDTIISFGEAETDWAIQAFGRNYKKATGQGEKVPRTFQSFIAKSVDGWVESQNPDDRYLSDDEQILAGLYGEDT